MAELIAEGINEAGSVCKPPPMMNSKEIERRYVPLFMSLGMEDTIRKRLHLTKIREVKDQMLKGLKERVIRIPANTFEKKRLERLKVDTSMVKKLHAEGSQRRSARRGTVAWNRRRTSFLPPEAIITRAVNAYQKENNKEYFEIRYKDILVPDEIFYSEAFQRIKKESILLSMNQAVHKFFRNKHDKVNRDMVCSWLGSLDDLVEISLSLMNVLMDYFKLEKYSHDYGKLILLSLPYWR